MQSRPSESGSVFTILLGALALSAAISVATYQLMSGPVATMARVTKKSMADTQMMAASKIAIMDAANQASSGDCDGDSVIEPREFRDAGTADAPEGGGFIPVEMGAPLTDPWGTNYGYCVWDTGSFNDPTMNNGAPGCGAPTRRLLGTPHPVDADPSASGANSQLTKTVLAIISAGPDRHFDTSCNAYVDGALAHDVLTTAGDDVVMRFTYAEAAAATSSLWSLKVGAPSTATINKDLEVGQNVTLTNSTSQISAPTVHASARVTSDHGVQVGTEGATTCDATTAAIFGMMRYNAATPGLEVCLTTGWTPIGAGAGGGAAGAAGDDKEIQFNDGGTDLGADSVFVWDKSTHRLGIGNDAPGALLDLGLAGATRGALRVAGSTSGNTTIAAADAAGNWTLTLPGNAGTGGYALLTDGAGATNWGTPSVPLNNILAADGDRAADHGAHTVGWSWNTLTTGKGLTLSSSSATSGSILSVENASASSTAGALNVSTASTGAGYGVYSAATGGNNTGAAVAGVNSGGGAVKNFGGYFETNATGTNAAAAMGEATATSGVTIGVMGRTASAGAAYGVLGIQQGTNNTGYAVGGFNTPGTNSGVNYGGYFETSTTGAGAAVVGEESATSGNNYGVLGRAKSAGAPYGVYGAATDAGNSGYGVYGLNDSATGYGVYGSSSAGSAVYSNGLMTVNGNLKIKDSASTHYAAFKANPATTADVLYVLPPADGTNGQVLTTDASHNLTWSTPTASTATSATTAGSVPINGIAAATADGSAIDNGAHPIIWNWNNVTTGNALTLGSNAITTGSVLRVNNTNGSSTGAAIYGSASNASAYGVFSSGTLGGSGNLKLLGSGSNYVAFNAGANPAAQTYTLPAAYPASNGYVLSSTTAGVLSWAADATGGGGGSSDGWAGATMGAGSQILRSGTTYGDLASGGAGPSVTLTTGTTAAVTLTANVDVTAAAKCFMSFAVSGASTIASADTRALQYGSNATANANNDLGMSATFYVDTLTAGSNVFTAQYKDSSSGKCKWSNRNVTVVAVGPPTSCSDATPDALAFTDVTGATGSSYITSDIVQVTGINCTVSIALSGTAGTPKYRICDNNTCSAGHVIADWATAGNVITNNQYVQIEMIPSSTSGDTRIATLTVGTSAANWSLVTTGDCTAASPAVGTVCADGTVYAGRSPDGNTKMFVTRCDAGKTWSGTACIGSATSFQWASTYTGTRTWQTDTILGRVQSYNVSINTLFGTPYPAAAYCESLTSNGKSDWYLPAAGELGAIYLSKASIGNFTTNAYWSTTEVPGGSSGENAYTVDFADGSVDYTRKDYGNNVRCTRREVADDFTFTDTTGASAGATVTSNTVTLSGMLSNATITCWNCTAIARNGTWGGTSVTGFNTGDTIALKAKAPPPGWAWYVGLYGGANQVPGWRTYWSVTSTGGDCTVASPTVGTVCADGTVYIGKSPDGNKKMYSDMCPFLGDTWAGVQCDSSGRAYVRWSLGNSISTGKSSTTTGKANSAALAALSNADAPYSAAQQCENLVQDGYSDWYLPALGELALFDTANLATLGVWNQANWVNSSTESSYSPGCCETVYAFDGSGGQESSKNYTMDTICVRREP